MAPTRARSPRAAVCRVAARDARDAAFAVVRIILNLERPGVRALYAMST